MTSDAAPDGAFGRVAVKSHFLSPSQWKEAQALAQDKGLSVEKALVARGFLTASQVAMIQDACRRATGSTVVSAQPADAASAREAGQAAKSSARLKKPEAPALPPPGKVGSYVLEKRLGGGANGGVFRARGPAGDDVAVKLLAPRPGLPLVESYLEEAEQYRKLSHPNLVPILEAGQEQGWGWAVMPLEDGEPAVRRVGRDGPLGTALAVRITAAAARGLGAAHQAGLVHLDVKPDNLLVDERGAVRVVDFGLGWRKLNARLGTPSYMAPERCLGSMPSNTAGRGDARPGGDGRSDVYGLGVTLFFLLTGRRPFPANSPEEAMLYHLKASIHFPATGAHVPRALQDLVLAMCAKEPGNRPAGMDEVLRRLETEFPLFVGAPDY